ncbi:phosphohistidine phosphatase SixA [Methylomonas sp. MED-D]|uniref:Histidine phosphatase family protein n=1 Tax=Methylomonas koyamae TaxID=702114 RepID=A0A177NDD1_9GAMM|nr:MULTISPECIES: phosphohistidine phosphatase SixA [Methylomonas]MDT4332454.1 phosphohistidine phosphatase SixA [Methylomonas sp. MV1]OAI15915.1 histidine phosphatase family protein [Methylomonas koyamae]WGS85379.1 phosphohistidine phosphatase SixA [Methylomonas sp. UP202]
MIITLLRHADAEPQRIGIADADRHLTEKGEKQAKRLARFCLRNRLLPGRLYASPLARAQQTAKLLQANLTGCPMPHTAPWLAGDNDTHTLLRELTILAEDTDDVWLVGHEPNYSDVVGQLLSTSPASVIVKKASLIRLEITFAEPATATLLWSIPCSLMH